MNKFDVGFMTYKDIEDVATVQQETARALVLMNNNLCLLLNELKTFNELCVTGINVNNREI